VRRIQARRVQTPKIRAGRSVSCDEGGAKIPGFFDEGRAEDRVVGPLDVGRLEVLGNGLG